MMSRNFIFRNAYGAVMMTLVICGLLFLASGNLDNTSIWYDETASFWISQGLNNYSDAHESRKGIRDVIRNNRSSNLDPGGHTVILHFWTVMGKDIAWLRLLSFMFLVVTVISMGLLAFEWSRTSVLCLFAMFLPFAFDPVLYHAFEIRAYSMETAGIVLGSFFLARFFNRPIFSNLLLLGISCGLFMWSRYTYIVFVLAAFCSCLYFLFTKPEDERKRLVSLSPAFLVPVIVSGALLCYVSLWYHLHHGMGLDYMSKWMVKGKGIDDTLEFIKINFFTLPALPVTAALLAFFFLRPFLHRYFPRFYNDTFNANFTPVTAPFYWLILTAEISSFLISLAGYAPWDISTRWSLHLIAISMTASLLLITECYNILRVLFENKIFPLIKHSGIMAHVSVLILSGLLAFHAATYRYEYPVNLASAIEYLNSSAVPKGSVFVAGYEIPAIRYLYEFGPYRESDRYPDIFRFQKISEWDESVPIDAAAEGLQYFVTAQSPERLTERLADGTAGKVSGVPHLLKMVPSQ